MAQEVKAVLEKIDLSVLNTSKESIASNMSLIEREELYFADNIYEENGYQVKIVSTSQVEAFHSQLKIFLNRSVSSRVGLRILDLFIFQVLTKQKYCS